MSLPAALQDLTFGGHFDQSMQGVNPGFAGDFDCFLLMLHDVASLKSDRIAVLGTASAA